MSIVKQHNSKKQMADPPEGFKPTELGPLPEEWDVVRLGEVVNFTRKPRGLDLKTCREIPFIPMEFIPDDGTASPTYVSKAGSSISSGVYCEPGDILFAKITPSLENGKQCIVSEVNGGFAYATTEVYPLKPKLDLIVRYYLFALLRYQAIRKELAAKMEGSTGRQRLSKHVLEHFLIPLPPLPEQRAIAQVLRAVQRAKETTERVIAATRELKKSLMRHLFTCGPVPIGARDAVPLQETKIGRVPEHWELVRLGEIADKPQYGYTASAVERPVGPKFLRITDIQNDSVNWASVPYCEMTEKSLEKYKLKPGDVVFARIGATTGKSYLVANCPTSVFGSYLIRVRVNPETIIPEYADYFAQTEAYLEQINAAKGGRLKQGISIPVLRSLLLPLPSPLEQRKIARTLQTVDRKIEAEENRKAALEALFKTLLHHLMTGKLRVPVELYQELASGDAAGGDD